MPYLTGHTYGVITRSKITYLFFLALFICACSSCKKTVTSSATVPPATPTDSSGQYGTPFSGVPDLKDIVMYEVNIRAFSAADNFAGIEPRLDSIKALGVNVIWLMPTYPVGTDNSPYCVQNYFVVNPEFGSLGDLQNFVSLAHAKGMAVILDWVTDGTSFNSNWIYFGYKSWYVLNAAGAIQANPDYADIAALNYNSKDMENALISGMQYWLQKANVDGFRCDNADNDPSSFWTMAIDSIRKSGHKLILLAESNNTDKFASGFQMNYGWTYLTALKNVFGSGASAATLATANATENSGTIPGTCMLRFITNHDEDRNPGTPLQLFGGLPGSMAAYVLAATMGGVPLIYDGQEVGCPISLDIFDTKTVIDWTANSATTGAYEQLMAFRNANDAVKEGAITYFGNSDVAVFEKAIAGDTMLVVVNVRNVSKTYTLDAPLKNTAWYDGMNNSASINLGTSLSLAPYQYLILKKQ